MQGRLSLPQAGRLQFFPLDWQEEFSRARDLGFTHIDWFLDKDIHNFDPVKDIWLKEDVLSKIDEARKTLPLNSIDFGRFAVFGGGSAETVAVCKELLPLLATRLTNKIIVFALVENLAPHTPEEKSEAQAVLKQIVEIASPLGLRIGLETDMPADELKDFVDFFSNGSVGVCYDTGNTVTLGFNAADDVRALGARVISAHLKDRKIGSTQSLLLGTGDVNFPDFFRALKDIGFNGSYTLQAWRGEDYIEDAKKQLAFTHDCLKQVYE